jgi:prepilin-type N-terminal cleavage/methylation domain-containing protein/prepilin-type processing-associated H-X9-DG protein
MVRKAGFTLIELLVVVSIIALLIAILLPALQRARERSYSTACAANLKGIGTSFQTYASEFDGLIPQASMRYPDGSSNGEVRYWYMFFNGDIGNTYWAFNPNKPNLRTIDLCPKANHSYHNGAPTGYGMYVWHSSTDDQVHDLHGSMTSDLGLAPDGVTHLQFNGFQTTRVTRPGDTMILADSSGGDGSAGWPPVDMSYSSVYVDRTSSSTQSRASAIWMPHMNLANLLFFDGHAAEVNVSGLKSIANYNKNTTRRSGVSVYKRQNGLVVTDTTPP